MKQDVPLTPAECKRLGASARDYDSLLIQCFAADITGESYPFSPEMTKIRLKDFTDEELGRKFARWCDAERDQ